MRSDEEPRDARPHRLGDRDTVDPVHEVVGVDESDEPKDRADGKDAAPEDRTVQDGQEESACHCGDGELDAQAVQRPDADDILG